ncbi:MAG: LysR family transcriptional regulator [Hyphomicrobiales bacterium]
MFQSNRLYSTLRKRVLNMEHPWLHADWNNIRAFTVVARQNSLRAAAIELGLSVNTVRRMIDRLEDQISCRLINRDVYGVSLTNEGRRFANAAADVERSMSDLWRVAEHASETMHGPIRLAITEGLGTFWLTPRLVAFIDEIAQLSRIELQCAMRSVDVLRLEADISVQLTEPTAPDLIRKQLGWLHLVPFASRGYLDRFGTPSDVQDLVNHRVVEQETDQLEGYGLDDLFGAETASRIVRLKTNFSSAHYWAISKGAGIGLLPNYAIAIGGDVEPVDLGFVYRVPIWMACHPEAVKTARHRAFLDWLYESFSSQTFPWFGPEYLSPADIADRFKGSALLEYFDGFTPRSAA